MMIQGSKGQEFDAGLLAGEFLRIAGSPKKSVAAAKLLRLKNPIFWSSQSPASKAWSVFIYNCC